MPPPPPASRSADTRSANPQSGTPQSAGFQPGASPLGASPLGGHQPAAPRSALSEVQRSLAAAEDEKLRRVIALLDSMEDRGAADHMLDAVRSRLYRLRLPRPLRFTRLLFRPLDLLIVPAAKWRPGDPAIPRTALVPIGNTVRAGLGAEALKIDGQLASCMANDTALIDCVGDRLWPAAADILAACPAPVGWEETGMPPSVYPPLATAIAAVLQRLPALRELAARRRDGVLAPNPDMLEAVCQGFETLPTHVQVMVMTLVMIEIPDIGTQVDPSPNQNGRPNLLRVAADQARDRLLAHLTTPGAIEGAVATSHLADAADEVRSAARLLGEMRLRYQAKEQRAAVQALYDRLDACCQEQFAAGLEVEFLAPLRGMLATGTVSSQPQLEAAARHLRNLEIEARRLGDGTSYDRLLRLASETVAVGGRTVLDTIQRVRLIELLAGSDAAMALWETEMEGDAA